MKTVIPYRGPSYSALRYASMRRTRSFTIPELMYVIGHRFSRPSKAGRSLDSLTKHGFLKRIGDTWSITESGYDYLRLTVQPSRGD